MAAWREAQKTLFPQWFNLQDAYRGQKPAELATREDARRVQVNYAYKNILTGVAMLVPADHDFAWEPIPEVGRAADDTDPTMTRFAETLKAETALHVKEIHFQDIIEGYGQDCLCYRMGCLKAVYDHSFIGSFMCGVPESRDKQDNIQRLRVLVEDYARRVFNDKDERYQRMVELKESLKVEGELETWAGLRVENIPLDCIRVSPLVRDLDRIHLSPWISHDTLKSTEELRAQFPYIAKADGTWEGIHPDDMERMSSGKGDNKIYGDTFWTTQTIAGAGTSANASPEAEVQVRRHVVREVWNRQDGIVMVLVESLEYPAATWRPERLTSNWYPFHFFRFNRVQGTPYGFPEVEMVKDIQGRMNRKQSDLEKARWLSIPRHVYDTQGNDEAEMIKLKDIDPGTMKGVNFQGKDPNDAIKTLAFELKIEAFDITKDEQDMRQMASLPEQVQGVTGRATFATEVNAATQGMAIVSNARMAKFQTHLEDIYHSFAELLVQWLSPEQVKQDCGANAIFPQIYSDSEGKRLYTEIQKQVDAEMQAQQQAAAFQAAAATQPGMAPAAPPTPTPDEAQSARAELIKTKCIAAFGFPEPITREALFKRLRCKVTVALNAQADRAQQGQSLLQLFQAIQAGGQAAQAAGLTFDPEPILKMAGNEEWSRMFKANPAQLGMKLVQALQSAPDAVPPELAMQVISLLQPIVQKAAMQAAAAAAANQSPAGGGQQPSPAQPPAQPASQGGM